MKIEKQTKEATNTAVKPTAPTIKKQEANKPKPKGTTAVVASAERYPDMKPPAKVAAPAASPSVDAPAGRPIARDGGEPLPVKKKKVVSKAPAPEKSEVKKTAPNPKAAPGTLKKKDDSDKVAKLANKIGKPAKPAKKAEKPAAKKVQKPAVKKLAKPAKPAAEKKEVRSGITGRKPLTETVITVGEAMDCLENDELNLDKLIDITSPAPGRGRELKDTDNFRITGSRDFVLKALPLFNVLLDQDKYDVTVDTYEQRDAKKRPTGRYTAYVRLRLKVEVRPPGRPVGSTKKKKDEKAKPTKVKSSAKTKPAPRKAEKAPAKKASAKKPLKLSK